MGRLTVPPVLRATGLTKVFGPREQEALRIIEGSTVAELRDERGVCPTRIWAIVTRLQRGYVSDLKRAPL